MSNVTNKTFIYVNTDGIEERVVTGDFGSSGNSVEIYADDGWRNGTYENIAVLVADIPKLIGALQAAYDHCKG